MTILYIVLGLIVIVLLWVMFAFNSLVTLRTRAKEAWADIEVQLKRRYDLIPNLVSTVKGYATHESTAFENVTKARAMAISASNAGTPAGQAAAEGQLTGALKSLFAISEAYPDLKANQNFLELQRQLQDTEDKIQASRRFYNGTVRDLNISIQSFPSNMIASSFGFAQMDLFELAPADQAANEAPKVQF